MQTTPHEKINVLNRGQRFAYIGLMIVGGTLTAVFGFWWFQAIHIPNNFSGVFHIFDILLFAILTYVVWYQICYELFSWYLTPFMRHPTEPPSPPEGMRVALLTAFVPEKEPYDVLERTVKAMIAVQYSHDTWVLDEGNDQEVIRICEAYGAIHYSRYGIPKYNTPDGKFKAKTKAGNYNSWFDQYAHRYDIVAQHDVDFVPHKNFFNRTLGYFIDPTIAFVGTPQIYGNTHESWIARGAAEQAFSFYGPMQKALYGQDMALFIGANHLVRVAAHDDIEGYSGHIVEDHLTGMKFYSKKWKSVYVPEILAIGEGPSTWDSYFGQQTRWAYGLIDILFRHSPSLFKRMRLHHRINYFLLQQYYFYGLAQTLGIILMLLYFTFGILSTSMKPTELAIRYIPLILFQVVVFFWLQRFYIDPKNESGFLLRGRVLAIAAWPIYFMAFLGALVGRRLTYTVTPKGNVQLKKTHPSLFIPHFVFGTITAYCLVASIIFDNRAPQILIWAVLNTIFMYGFCIAAVTEHISVALTKKIASPARFFSE